MVCLINICVNTLHKGDCIFTYNNNNNNNNKCYFPSLGYAYTIVPGKAETVRIGEDFPKQVIKIQRGEVCWAVIFILILG
jgi:hypothetical protein